MVALSYVATRSLECPQRLLVLDALGHRVQLEPVREVDDRLDHLARRHAVRQVADELDVDLEVVDRELLQIREAAVACPEVVERDLAAELVQGGDELAAGELV